MAQKGAGLAFSARCRGMRDRRRSGAGAGRHVGRGCCLMWVKVWANVREMAPGTVNFVSIAFSNGALSGIPFSSAGDCRRDVSGMPAGFWRCRCSMESRCILLLDEMSGLWKMRQAVMFMCLGAV